MLRSREAPSNCPRIGKGEMQASHVLAMPTQHQLRVSHRTVGATSATIPRSGGLVSGEEVSPGNVKRGHRCSPMHGTAHGMINMGRWRKGGLKTLTISGRCRCHESYAGLNVVVWAEGQRKVVQNAVRQKNVEQTLEEMTNRDETSFQFGEVDVWVSLQNWKARERGVHHVTTKRGPEFQWTTRRHINDQKHGRNSNYESTLRLNF